MTNKKKPVYRKLSEEEFYRMGKGRGVIKVSEEEESKNKTVSFSKEFNDGEKWIPRRGKFFAVSFRHIGKILDILIKFAGKFGWKIDSLKEPERQIKELKRELDDALKQKEDLLKTTKELEKEIERYQKNLEELREKILENNQEAFKKDVHDFEELLEAYKTDSRTEEDIQKFLKEKKWIFSPEYHNVEPKKPVGSKSIYDFYLEDYKGQGTVIELKLPSDPIFSDKEKYGFSPKSGESLGQLIRYIETTIATSHSKELSRIERIDETRPLGFLIIGRTETKDEIEQLKIVNSYLHFMDILSYDMLLMRAKSFIQWLDNE